MSNNMKNMVLGTSVLTAFFNVGRYLINDKYTKNPKVDLKQVVRQAALIGSIAGAILGAMIFGLGLPATGGIVLGLWRGVSRDPDPIQDKLDDKTVNTPFQETKFLHKRIQEKQTEVIGYMLLGGAGAYMLSYLPINWQVRVL